MLWKTYHHTDIGLFSWLQWCQQYSAASLNWQWLGGHRPDLRLVAAARAGACTCRAADGDGWRREDWKNPNLKWLVSLLFRDVSNLFDVYKTFLVPSGPIHQSINLSILSIDIPFIYLHIIYVYNMHTHIRTYQESLKAYRIRPWWSSWGWDRRVELFDGKLLPQVGRAKTAKNDFSTAQNLLGFNSWGIKAMAHLDPVRDYLIYIYIPTLSLFAIEMVMFLSCWEGAPEDSQVSKPTGLSWCCSWEPESWSWNQEETMWKIFRWEMGSQLTVTQPFTPW